ncbi:MAG: hypothetical protein IK066_09045 [Kiritimatiellae bacterium]|nr:hypothetical protein [Kiritimatiellia bacterium]
MKTTIWKTGMAGAAAALCLFAGAAKGEAILQVFNQSHNEIAARLPEIAEAGYTALWVPPPTKANGGMSVGYDLNDPFDIGNSDLRGTWSTRYGVEADLHNLIEMCHRFGMRVYFDNVMNHRSYDIPGYNESTPTDVYPGMCPEDFHLRTTSDGFYRKWDNVRDWNDEWQVMFLGLSDLLDIAHETPNQNFGATEGSWHDKPRFVRHPNNPEYYDWDPDGNVIGFGPENGLTVEDIAANPDKYSEDVGGYLCRAVRWLVDRTRVDGLRLDAVKHVPYYFFGAQNDDGSFDGYVGNVQLQFNRSRGFYDRNNRDTVFNSDAPRNDAMLFGEHLGNPPPQGPYVGAGMRLVDDRLRNELNWRFSANQLEGFDNDGAGSELGSACGVMHAQSHDNDYVDRKPLHHAMYFMRRGLGLVYSDGNNHAATLTGSGGAFPRWAQTDFLGQWHQKQIPTLLHAHENFARYDQIPKWSSGNYIAFQRGGDGDYATMLFMLNSAWDWWEPTKTRGDFPRDAWLYDYASDMYMPYFVNEGPAADYAWGGDLEDGNVNLPPNSYAIWNWKNPDPSALYPTPYPDCFANVDDRVIAPDARVITLMEDGQVAEPVWVWRKDGVDGDPDFNPYGVADTNNADYAYRIAIPRVTKGTNVTLAVKGDGSTESLLLRLDGGMDFGNHDPDHVGGAGWGHYWEQQRWDTEDATDRPDWRDNPPGSSHDFYLGFEDAGKWFTRRIWSEKFASVDTDYCKIGTQGATSYEAAGGGVVAHTNATVYEGARINEPGFVYHDPSAETEAVPVETGAPVTSTNTYSALASVNGQGGADGFGDWVDSSTDGGSDGGAGWFVHDTVGDTGLTGFAGGKAYGLWAKYSQGDGWPNAQVTRALTHGGKGLLRAGVDVGMKFDSAFEGRFKGVEFTDASGNAVFGVQMQNTPEVTYYGAGGSGTWSGEYGQKAFRVELERTSNGYRVTGTTRDGGTFGPLDIETGAEIAGFKAYMNGVLIDDYTDDRQLYFDNLAYTAVVTTTPTGDRQVPQFAREGTGATVWAKTSHEQGARTFLYYTVDGAHWPEGGGGVPANPYTKAVEGNWKADSESGSWWRFDLPEGSVPSGAALRYKISAFREQGYGGNEWGTVWPGDANAIAIKKAMMSLWMVDGLDFTTQQYHKHNDYTSWTTGFKDGYHLATARLLLNRNDGAPVANTFRQTFYLDTHAPEGYFLYPSEKTPTFGDSEYGMVFKTDNTVDEVWVHITDADDSNDTVGNGKTTNGVEWARATQISPWTKEMAQDTEFTKIWRFTYSRIPSEGEATIRVRLREVSSAPVDEWSKDDPAEDDLEALHVAELVKVANARGPEEKFYIEWPDQDGTMVEAGWDIRVRYTARMAAGLDDADLFGKFKIYVNASSNGSTERGDLQANGDLDMRHQWEWGDGGNGLNTLWFKMPNVYNGIDGWRYGLTVDFDNENGYGNFSKTAARMITHAGPLLPTCIVTTPPETDSDGVKYVITMEDSTAAREDRTLRETPIVVLTDKEAKKVELEFVSPVDYAASISATPSGGTDNDVLRFVGVEGNGTSRTWTFAWQATNAGTYRVQAKVTVDNSSGKYSAATNGALRTATIQFRQLVRVTDANDQDWDDDGAVNAREQENAGRPSGESEYWTQDAIFDYWSTGKSDPDCPDSDGDGLPDALELGYRKADDGTDTSVDTNGDGWPNFIWDRDPPFYNSCESLYGKVPGVTSSTEGGDRLALVKGSTTDPRNSDSDGDGLPDGVEDANRNGWTDGDGAPLPGDWDPYWDRNWPDGKIGAKETWEETSPCIWDSDADGLCDGYGEDLDLDGCTDMALLREDGTLVPIEPADYAALGIGIDNASSENSASTLSPKPCTSRAINYDALFAAFNVTNPDGPDGTLQTNGWPLLVITETDPLCTDTDHDGLPDGWEVAYNLDPLNNGVYDFRTGQFSTNNAIHGPKGNPDGDTYIQGGGPVPYDNAAEYLGGTNPRSPDNSGGGSGAGSLVVGSGDPIGSVNGNTFFTECTQWTLDDLVALDNYNQGGNSSDIYRFGDGFDSSRDMVAFYFRDGRSSAEGGDDRLYFRVDFDDLQAFAEESSLNVYVAMNFGNYGNGIEMLPDDVNCKSAMKWNAVSGVYDSKNGCLYVQRANSEDAYDIKNDRFLGAWFNSEIDTVVWSIDRTALVEAGWNGLGDNLMFQVFTTRDFTNDDGGSGDKGGLNDFADTIGDDWLCSDYWNDYNYISQHGVYSTCVSRTGNDHAWNNRGQHAKLAMIAHGNQAIEPGNAIQALVNNGQGAGYDRPVQIHNIYTNCPLNLHVTPTLAIALQWAEVGTENAWYSGPALNAAIRKGVAGGALSLIGSTYSDHMPKYFPDDFNAANVARARDVLEELYGSNAVSTRVLWSPERVVDADWLVRLGKLGYQATIVDQTPHLLDWFGRQTALGNDAYKIQRYWIEHSPGQWTSEDAFALSSAANDFRYANTDSGLASDLRRLFLRRARTGEAAISSIFYMWEDFAGTENADAYDRSLRWIANHPWIQVVTLDQALDDETLSGNVASRNLYATNGMAMQDWVHHACNGNYDNWYYGSGRHESLAAKKFEVREGKSIDTAWGDATGGILKETWDTVKSIGNPQLRTLAEATLFASAFETAFHNESNGNLSRWSYGEYIYPATEWEGLMSMAWRAQSRTRLAAVYKAVDEWAGMNTGLEAFAKDIDLDGEDEWILRNNSVMAVFEAEGGLMVGAWYKDGTGVRQMVGNFAAQPETGYETQSAAADSTRGTAMKDISIGGTSTVAEPFGVTPGAGELVFNGDGLTKTVKLADADAAAFDIAYKAPGKKMYVRNGLSPDLATLMIAGQSRMTETADGTRSLTVATTLGGTAVNATLSVTEGEINTAATDWPEGAAWNTVNLRNAPQVRQVEVSGTGALAYQIAFSTSSVAEEPPTIAVSPEGEQVFPVGQTTSFRVTASDWQGNALPVECTDMPAGQALTGQPKWDASSGVFSWNMGAPSEGTRTNDWTTQASFAAGDAHGNAEVTVPIRVPFDSVGNKIGDDWEYVAKRKSSAYTTDPDGDADDDGFDNYSEWVAGTDPTDGNDYIAWEEQYVQGTNLFLKFKSVPGAPYEIEETTPSGLVAGGTNWVKVADVTGDEGPYTLWSRERPGGESRMMYRIHVPFMKR